MIKSQDTQDAFKMLLFEDPTRFGGRLGHTRSGKSFNFNLKNVHHDVETGPQGSAKYDFP